MATWRKKRLRDRRNVEMRATLLQPQNSVFDKLPKFIKGFGTSKVDISVHIDGSRKPTLDSLRTALVA